MCGSGERERGRSDGELKLKLRSWRPSERREQGEWGGDEHGEASGSLSPSLQRDAVARQAHSCVGAPGHAAATSSSDSQEEDDMAKVGWASGQR